jgi:hypothetical protein
MDRFLGKRRIKAEWGKKSWTLAFARVTTFNRTAPTSSCLRKQESMSRRGEADETRRQSLGFAALNLIYNQRRVAEESDIWSSSQP